MTAGIIETNQEVKKCIYLTGKCVRSCQAGKGGYVPSLFELEKFCTNSKYSICPVYCGVDPGVNCQSSTLIWSSSGYSGRKHRISS